MVSITNKLEELFKKWTGNNEKDFTRDGVIDEEKYENATKRILFILKEPSAPLQKSIEDAIKAKIILQNDGRAIKTLCDLIRVAWKGVRYRTFSPLGSWAYGLINMDKTFEEANKKENKDEAFLNSAIMNLKKIPRKKCNYAKLCEYVSVNKGYIKEEIEIIDPAIAVCCGTFDVLREKEVIPFRKISNSYGIYKTTEGKEIIFIKMCHPGAMRKGEDKYKELIENYKSAKAYQKEQDEVPV